jgi:hypothetical protein
MSRPEDIISPGDALTAARLAADLLLALVPHETAGRLIDEAAARRQNAIADAAERAKFGPHP